MRLLLLLLLWQSGQDPTVGDTVWITRTIRVPPRTSVRPRPVESSEILDPLGSPDMVLQGGSVLLRYPIVFWHPGSHEVQVPGPILVRPDGWSDTLLATRERITVLSVLPDLPKDSVDPSPAVAPIDRRDRSGQPALVLLILAGLAGLPAYFWWNRRGPTPAGTTSMVTLPSPERLDRWLAAGEHRVVLDAWRDLLLRSAAGDERESLLQRLETARYGDANADHVRDLCAEARAAHAEVWGSV